MITLKKLNMISIMMVITIPSFSEAMLQQVYRYVNASVSSATLIETFNQVQTSTYVISQPGIYLMAQDFAFFPVAAVPAIHITVSGVQLDLNQRLLAQANATAGVMGIQVDPGLTGVNIHNGAIAGFTDTAISFGAGNSLVQIQDIIFKSCQKRVLDFAGTLGNELSQGLVQKVAISQCATSAAADYVINLEYVNNFYLNNVGITLCGNGAQNMTMFNFSNVTKSQLVLPAVADNVGADFVALGLSECTDIIGVEFKAVNNAATGDLTVIRLSGLVSGSNANTFRQAVMVNNVSSAGNCIGIDIGAMCEGNLFQEAKVLENQGLTMKGVNFAGVAGDNLNNGVGSSHILRNVATTGDCTGIYIDGSNSGTVKNTQVGYNTAPNGVATGLLLTGAGGDLWGVRQSEFFDNVGSSNANSFGINWAVGADNIFIQNVAFLNGATAANQIAGPLAFTLGSVQYALFSNLNTAATGPWSNIAVT